MPVNSATPLVVYGAGGFGREVAWLASRASEPRDVVAYADDGASSDAATLSGLPLISLDEAARRFPGADFSVAVGSATAREKMVARAIAAGLRPTRLVHRHAEISSSVQIGEGSVVCAGCILTVDITIGAHVHINLDCTIGHDAVLEDFVTLAPGVHVSGWVRIERGAYIGTGASIINGTSGAPMIVGAGAVIGAGAVVTRAISPGVTAVGIPARARG
jgi:sugar O-acyltransferase (sialic acid O-acetyltransferase NeuD family)